MLLNRIQICYSQQYHKLRHQVGKPCGRIMVDAVGATIGSASLIVQLLDGCVKGKLLWPLTGPLGSRSNMSLQVIDITLVQLKCPKIADG